MSRNHEMYEQICKDMVGKTYGTLTVIEYLGVQPRYYKGVEDKAARMVKVRCECGAETVYEASHVRSAKPTHCRFCASQHSKRIKPLTLCWDCKKATNRNLCPWAGGTPRDDWDAIPTTLHEGELEDGSPRIMRSFAVRGCPAFEEG